MRRSILTLAAGALLGGVACQDATAPTVSPVPAPSRTVVAATPVVVSAADMHGWTFGGRRGRACTNGATCRFATGPATPPLGMGSVELTSTRSAAAVLAFHGLAGTRLDAITALRLAVLDTARPAANDALMTVELTLDDQDGRLVSSLSSQGERKATKGWRTVDARAGAWWGTREELLVGRRRVRNPCVEGSPCTWQRVLRLFPDLAVRDSGALLIRTAHGASAHVDAVAIGVRGVTTTYDLELAASGATDTLTILTDDGVLGTPVASDSPYPHGSLVSYGYSAPADRGTLTVYLDGVATTATGSVRMDGPHSLLAVLTPPSVAQPGDQEVADAIRALTTAADPIAAFQRLLDLAGSQYASQDEQVVSDRIERATAAALDVVRDSAAIRRVDAALGGHFFNVRVSPGEGGAAISSRGRAARRASPISSAAAAAEALGETAEPTAIFYVNGVGNAPSDAAVTAAHLGALLRQNVVRFRDPHDVVMRLMYNRNDDAQGGDAAARRRCLAGVRPGLAHLLAYARCRNVDMRLFTGSLVQDLLESKRILGSRTLPVGAAVLTDIDGLRDSLRVYRASGRHVIVMPHSEGNLITERALTAPASGGSLAGNGTPTSIAVVPMASPTTHYAWLSPPYVRPVELEGDIILMASLADPAADAFPPSSNTLDATMRAARSAGGGSANFLFFRQLYDGYIMHGMSSYLAPDGGRSFVMYAAQAAYDAVATRSVVIFGPPDSVLLGTSTRLGTDAYNGAGDPVTGRPVTWSSASTTMTLAQDGTVRILAPGGSSVDAQVGLAIGSFTLLGWSMPPVVRSVTCSKGATSDTHPTWTTTYTVSVDASPSDTLAPIRWYILRFTVPFAAEDGGTQTFLIANTGYVTRSGSMELSLDKYFFGGDGDGSARFPAPSCSATVIDVWNKQTIASSQ